MKKENLISDSYCKVNADIYNKSKRSMGGAKHAIDVEPMAAKWGVETILDYGCGQGQFKTAMNELNKDFTVTEYDPAIYGKEALPSPVDLVMCADVLEHVEPDKIDNVLKHIYDLSGMGAYLVISLCETKVFLPDGRNAHILLMPVEWWITKLCEYDWEIRSCIIRVKKKEMKDLILWLKKN